jgi:hypothetical protein
MLQRMMDDLRTSTGTALRMTSLVIAVAGSLLITTGFLTAAAFIAVLQRYGLIEACLTGAAIFFIVTMIAALSYVLLKRQAEHRAIAAARAAAEQAKSTASNILADPAMLAIGLQVARAIGLRKLIPLLAIGGVALGVFASRREPTEETPSQS